MITRTTTKLCSKKDSYKMKLKRHIVQEIKIIFRRKKCKTRVQRLVLKLGLSALLLKVKVFQKKCVLFGKTLQRRRGSQEGGHNVWSLRLSSPPKKRSFLKKRSQFLFKIELQNQMRDNICVFHEMNVEEK
jgi:hypothetical protein